MGESIEYHYQVRWGETDAAGIVFYPNFYAWMDEATHHFFTKVGHSTSELMENKKISIPLVEAKCEFKSPLLFGDQVIIKSFVSSIRNKIFTISHTFFKNGEKIAEGYEVRAWADFSNQKPKAVPIPNEVRKILISSQTVL